MWLADVRLLHHTRPWGCLLLFGESNCEVKMSYLLKLLSRKHFRSHLSTWRNQEKLPFYVRYPAGRTDL